MQYNNKHYNCTNYCVFVWDVSTSFERANGNCRSDTVMRGRAEVRRAAASLVERLKSNMGVLTQAERRVAHVLFGNNLILGLDTVAALAAQPRASGPTVLRFVAEQGFSGYPDFQRALREELSARRAPR